MEDDVNTKYKRALDYPRPKGIANGYLGHFPMRTCAASRHTVNIADMLRDFHHPLRRWLIDEGYEPDLWAQSLEHTAIALWEERNRNS